MTWRNWKKKRQRLKVGISTPEEEAKADYQFELLVGTPEKPALIEEFAEELRDRGVTDKYRCETDRVLRRTIGACDMQTVGCMNADAVKRYLNRLRRNGLSARSRNAVQRAMHLFAEYLRERGRLQANPFSDLSTAKEAADKREQSRSLTFEEAEKLLAVAGPRRLYYLFRLRTGLDAASAAA